jgi:hypothetical protein
MVSSAFELLVFVKDTHIISRDSVVLFQGRACMFCNSFSNLFHSKIICPKRRSHGACYILPKPGCLLICLVICMNGQVFGQHSIPQYPGLWQVIYALPHFQIYINHYHMHFTSVFIMDQETMTRFLKGLNYAKIQSLAAGNKKCSEHQLAGMFLTSVKSTRKPHQSVIRHMMSEKYH